MKDFLIGSALGLLLVSAVYRLGPPPKKPELPDYMWVCNQPTVSGATYCTPQPATNYEVK